MVTKNSLLTYQDGHLKEIASLWGDRLERLTLVEKFWILRSIAEWGESCHGLEEADWYNFHGFIEDHSDLPESDALDLMLDRACNWTSPVFAMPLVIAIANQIAEGIYQAEEEE
ncbi:hypothetical protein [Phormidesmis sp. 146-33]